MRRRSTTFDKVGVTELMADKNLDAAGEDLVERICLKLMAENPTALEADVRAAVYAWWVH